MPSLKSSVLAVSSILVSTIAALSSAHADLIGLQAGNNTTLAGVYRIDTTTGTQTLLGNSGFAALQDLALAPDGTYYAVAGSSTTTPTSQLITINPTTGAGMLVAPLTTTDPGGISFMTGLGVGTDGTLYGAGLTVGGSVSNLYSINRTTGVASLIGTTNAASMQALTVNAATGVAYGVNTAGDAVTRGLRTVDLATGASTFVGPVTPSGAQGIQDIAFTSDGSLWGVDQQGNLFTVAAGGLTLKSNGLAGFRGLENYAVVPLPAAVWLFGSGLAAMVGVVRRRQTVAQR